MNAEVQTEFELAYINYEAFRVEGKLVSQLRWYFGALTDALERRYQEDRRAASAVPDRICGCGAKHWEYGPTCASCRSAQQREARL